jgi:hypothetical protein
VHELVVAERLVAWDAKMTNSRSSTQLLLPILKPLHREEDNLFLDIIIEEQILDVRIIQGGRVIEVKLSARAQR